ncbi:hypothetical protein Sya03_14960 [Spirilliplanes yamanashiensis]|uniref:Uncharacterized protein n=1 Tax=Spirilliplanes yamanashiensis TaxID=42233 RepID=A0A8J4DI96_9ACTN|nr:hypothetical protein Sya03_14960 [Spirilliplanes yamanashiensis]
MSSSTGSVPDGPDATVRRSSVAVNGRDSGSTATVTRPATSATTTAPAITRRLVIRGRARRSRADRAEGMALTLRAAN